MIRPFASIAANNAQISLKQSKSNIAKRIVCVQLGLTRWALEMSKLNQKDENQKIKSHEAFNALAKAMQHVPGVLLCSSVVLLLSIIRIVVVDHLISSILESLAI